MKNKENTVAEKTTNEKAAVLARGGTAGYVPCPKCKHPKILTASCSVEYFYVDEEPYVSGTREEGEIMKGEFSVVEIVMVTIQYCENCDTIISKCFNE